MEEVWKIIPNTKELYEASNLGNIRRVVGFVKNNINGGKRAIGGKNLSPKTKKNGYKEVNLNIERQQKMFYVHRAVFSAFNDVDMLGLEVNHKDGDKANNNIKNLELITPSDNMKHAYRLGLNKIKTYYGESHPRAKLTDAQVLEIREEHSIKRNVSELSKKYNIGKSQIVRIVSNKGRII